MDKVVFLSRKLTEFTNKARQVTREEWRDLILQIIPLRITDCIVNIMILVDTG